MAYFRTRVSFGALRTIVIALVKRIGFHAASLVTYGSFGIYDNDSRVALAPRAYTLFFSPVFLSDLAETARTDPLCFLYPRLARVTRG